MFIVNKQIKKFFNDMNLSEQRKTLDSLEKVHVKSGGVPRPPRPKPAPSTSRNLPRPFLKWAGGKAKVLPYILGIAPEKIGTYYEPFLGGGAVFFEFARKKAFKRAVLADANESLVNCYVAIRDDIEGVLAELGKPEYKYGKEEYLSIRAKEPDTSVEKAARFIYLNRTCFNGLYRVNKAGKFNVPFGEYSNPTIKDTAVLKAASAALQGATLLCCDFKEAVKGAKKGDVVYFDPPYIPLSKTSSFTAYTNDGFSDEDHRRLENFFSKLACKGVTAILSNSSAELSKELYGKYNPAYLNGSRNIGGPASYRGNVTEMLVGVNLPDHVSGLPEIDG